MDADQLIQATSRQIEAEIQRLAVEQDRIKEHRQNLKKFLVRKLIEEEKLKSRGLDPFERK
jgi:hypothetical protein